MWAEDFVNFVKDNCIPVAVDARKELRRKDPTGEFVRKSNCVTRTAAGQMTLVAADGTRLGDMWYGNIPGRNEKLRMGFMRNAWKKWLALPEEVRRPGGVKLGDASKQIDTTRTPHKPPPGALIVRTYNRQFEPDGKGGLRYTEPEDYPTEPENHRRSAARYREAAQDFMWVPEREWRAMIPANPKKGDSFDAPESFRARVFRFHLDPCRGLGEGVTFSHVKSDAGTMTLTVEDVSPKSIRLRIDGKANLDNGKTSYHPVLLGYLTYDRAAKRVTDFRMVALGTVNNTPRGVRPGAHPLGIAFEYVANPKPSELVHPRGARDDLPGYLAAVR